MLVHRHHEAAPKRADEGLAASKGLSSDYDDDDYNNYCHCHHKKEQQDIQTLDKLETTTTPGTNDEVYTMSNVIILLLDY